FRAKTPIESGDFDQLGVVFERMDGYHSLFAAQVIPQPFESVLDRKWGWTPYQLLLEVMDRQRRFIASLHWVDPSQSCPNSHLKTVALRYLRRPGSDTIDLTMMGKVFAAEADQAKHLALGWWQEIASLFTYDYELVPASSPEAFEELSGLAYLDEIDSPTQMAEIRRYEMFTPRPGGQTVTEGDYVLLPFAWHPNGMEQVWRAMALLPCLSLVNVTLRPTCLYEAEEIHLSQLRAAAQKQASSDQVDLQLQGQLAAWLYTTQLSRLQHPFLMRVQVAAGEEGLVALARAVGTTLAYAPLTQTQPEQEALSISYDIAMPSSDELVIAKENLRVLEFHGWGNDQAAPPYRRFRYLFDVTGAHCAFRLPFMPKGGLPGLQFTGLSFPARQ
ncbi:MAG: hypothetical protein ACFFGP_02655, partial [Promethearchaeota archaeon]